MKIYIGFKLCVLEFPKLKISHCMVA